MCKKIMSPFLLVKEKNRLMEKKGNQSVSIRSSLPVSLEIQDLTCPISGQIFFSPVIGQDGIIYEEEAIKEWLQNKKTSPINKTTEVEPLAVSYTFKNLVEKALIEHPELRAKQYRVSLFSLLKKGPIVDPQILNSYSFDELIRTNSKGCPPLVCSLYSNPYRPEITLKLIELITKLDSNFNPSMDSTLTVPNSSDTSGSGAVSILYRGRTLLAHTCRDPKYADVALEFLRLGWYHYDDHDRWGSTPLSLCCENGSETVSIEMIKARAFPLDSRDGNFDTPFLIACRYGQPKAAELLLSTGSVDPGATNDSGTTPLIACLENDFYELAEKILNTEKANPGQINRDGDTALTLACHKIGTIENRSTEKERLLRLINLLIENPGSRHSWSDRTGMTALMHLCKNKLAQQALLLLQRPLDSNSLGLLNEDGYNALFLACKEGLEDVANAILDQLENGSPIIQQTLKIACEEGLESIVLRLIRLAPMHCYSVTDDGESAFDCAKKKNWFNVCLEMQRLSGLWEPPLDCDSEEVFSDCENDSDSEVSSEDSST